MSRQPVGYSQWFNGAVAKAANDAHDAMMRDPFAGPWHVYYKPNGLALVVANASPGDGWTCDAKAPSDRTIDQLHVWLHNLAMSLPLLPARDPTT